jgi:hypothetical protein
VSEVEWLNSGPDTFVYNGVFVPLEPASTMSGVPDWMLETHEASEPRGEGFASEAIKPFLGTWVLDPSKCQYEHGDPPRSATYRIRLNGSEVAFALESVLSDGWVASYTYSIVPDGRDRPSPDPDLGDTMMTRVIDRTLETVCRRNGLVVLHNVRTLSDDGKTLAVSRAGVTQLGVAYRNRSVYFRNS